jgi:hypothetical protein
MYRKPRLSILLVIACALFLKALVPVGWMPAPQQGAFAIQPCPAADPAPSMRMGSIHYGNSHHGSNHDRQHDVDCSFSPLLAGLAPPEIPATIQESAISASGPLALSLAFAPKTGPPARPPPATGPPTLA